jgi:uncharacterized lipoprotein YbaY
MRSGIVAFAVGALLLLGACRTVPDAPAAAPAHGAQIRASAFYFERIALSPDTVLSVQLIDDRLADTPKAIVTAQQFTHLRGPPYEFALNYDPRMLLPDGSYSLFAALRGPDGHLEFVTEARVPVVLPSEDVVSFRLVRAGASAQWASYRLVTLRHSVSDAQPSQTRIRPITLFCDKPRGRKRHKAYVHNAAKVTNAQPNANTKSPRQRPSRRSHHDCSSIATVTHRNVVSAAARWIISHLTESPCALAASLSAVMASAMPPIENKSTGAALRAGFARSRWKPNPSAINAAASARYAPITSSA